MTETAKKIKTIVENADENYLIEIENDFISFLSSLELKGKPLVLPQTTD